MYYRFAVCSNLVLAMGIIVCVSSGFAAEENPSNARRSGRPVTQWDVSASLLVLPDSGLHGTNFDVGLVDYSVKLGRNLAINEQLTVNVAGGYGLKHIDAEAAAGLPSDLHSLTLELGGSYKTSSQSFVTLKASPGLSSDFNGGGGNILRMPLLLLGGYNFENGFTAVGGFMYRFGFHSTQAIPAIGFSYQPNDRWRFDAIAPRPAITYNASRQIKLFVAGDFASDEYGINKKNHGAEVITYSDLKLSGGVTCQPIPPVRISAAAGYAFDRQFTFYDGFRTGQRLDNVPFFRISLDMGW